MPIQSNSRMTSQERLEEVTAKLKRYAKIGAIALVALTIFFGSFSTVGPGERGVMITLGKTGETVLGEGPHLKFPLVSSIRTMSIRVHKSEDTSEAATKDLQRVAAKVALNWTINPDSVGKMLREVGGEDSIENNIIAPAVAEVMKAATAKMTAEEVLTRRIELKQNIDEALMKRLTSYGLIVKDISLVDLNFTNEFNHAVEAKQIAEQEAKQAEYVAQKATQDAKASVNKAKGEAEANIALAKAEAESSLVKARAQSEGQKLLRQTLDADVLKLEYLKKWNGVLPQVMSGSGSGMILNLPSATTSSASSKASEESEEEENN